MALVDALGSTCCGVVGSTELLDAARRASGVTKRTGGSSPSDYRAIYSTPFLRIAQALWTGPASEYRAAYGTPRGHVTARDSSSPGPSQLILSGNGSMLAVCWADYVALLAQPDTATVKLRLLR
jgi:hypothetical protein